MLIAVIVCIHLALISKDTAIAFTPSHTKPSSKHCFLAGRNVNNLNTFFLPPQPPLLTMMNNQTNGENGDAVQNLIERAISLQSQKWDSIRILEKTQLDSFNSNNAHDINSIVFLLGNKEDSENQQSYILAILSQDDRVNLSKLQNVVSEALDHVNNPKITLAPTENLSGLCGFPSGCVPPLGLQPSPIVTFVEESLLHLPESVYLFGGGGAPDRSTILPLRTILDSVPNVHTASFRQGPVTSTLSTPAIQSAQQLLKPFLCIEPPDIDAAKQILSGSSSHSSLVPETFTMVGRVSGVRQIARRLVFADLAPPQDGVDEEDHPWRNPQTRDDMALQLILGKSIMQNLGDQEGELALRSLKKGQLILFKGTTNVDNLDSLINWVSKRSLDVRVVDYQVLLPSRGIGRDEDGVFSWQQTSRNNRQPKKTNTISKKNIPSETSNMEFLQLSDLYTDIVDNENGDSDGSIVDSEEAVKDMYTNISNWLESHPQEYGLVGIDCEWKPNFMADSNEAQPVLLMQVCFHPLQRVYLLDLQTLLRPLLPRDSPMNNLELATSNVINRLFEPERLVKTGFKLINDFQRLAASYPHISEFQQVNTVLEASKTGMRVAQLTKQAHALKATSSLSRMSEHFFEKTLNKAQQVSDWSRRPLTAEQIQYAILDAVITPCLIEYLLNMVDAKLGDGPKLSRFENDTAFSDALKSWKFIILTEKEDRTAIRRLNAKRVVGPSYIATQSWVTGRTRPSEPDVPDDDNEPFTDVHGITRVPSHTVSIVEGEGHIIDAMVGVRIANSKDECLKRVLEENSLLQQPDHKLDFPQRSGYVEFENAVALFVTMPFRKGQLRKYPNEWMNGGSILSWFIHDETWQDGSSRLARKMTVNEEGGSTVILFVRRGKEPFLCCGRCHIASSDNTNESTIEKEERIGNILKLNLLLTDWDKLEGVQEFLTLVGP